ncbi:RluA family pseudouridine synthase [Treponema parvum]|uniref:Pseudouridine synthase n=1 Tax=Treponema parvum TaxID=138851 RepID=A0A975ICL2_9SPIR|nr:RluA family pseudouridine synthase [Treponema parvum]QTQ11833.1 RluA family pseudouridine synthase [Treponema parvum]QTQ16193.1 RluA family pseudouridine synthase [Treponema parvum]
MSFFNLTVPKEFCGTQRLDQYAADNIPDMNRSKLKNGILEISINGKHAKLSSSVKAGDGISIKWEDPVPENIAPENIPLDIIFENDQVTVVNKPQGLVTHPAAGNWSGTLVNALLYHWNKDNVLNDAYSRRTGIIHRLDKDTSGVIITAKTRAAEDFIQKQFQKRLVLKEYVALVKGRPPHRGGCISTRIIRDPGDRKRFKAVTGTNEGKYAKTVYFCIACYGGYSLMRFRLKTGRTHQIRVHSKYIGCPILGDPIYNSKKEELFPSASLMLHSRFLRLLLPGEKKYSEFYAKIPDRFKRILKTLHCKYAKEIVTT